MKMTLVVDPFISIKMKYCQLMHYYNYTNSAKPTHKVLFSLSVFSTSLIKILICWHGFQDPCWQAWTNKLCWWTEASVTGCTANGVYWKFKRNRFCYNWVHTALSFLFVGKIFEITTGAKCVISSLFMKHISLKNDFLTYKINSKLSTEYLSKFNWVNFHVSYCKISSCPSSTWMCNYNIEYNVLN